MRARMADAFRLQLAQDGLVVGPGLDDHGTERLQPAAQHRLRVPRRLHGEEPVAVADDSSGRGQRVQPLPPGRGLARGHVAHPEERLVHLLRVLRPRPRLLAHARHRGRVERAEVVGGLHVEDAARHHRLRAPLLERRVVEERVGLAGEDPAREGRRLAWCRWPRRSMVPSRRPRRTSSIPSTSMASVRQSSTVWRTIGMVLGDLDRPAGQRLRAGQRGGEGGRQQVLGPHPHQVRGHALAVAAALEQQRALRVPAPAGAEHRRRRAGPARARRARCWGAGSRRPRPAGSCAAARG